MKPLITAFLIKHATAIAIGVALTLYWTFSAAVSSMDPPTATDTRSYRWKYNFLNKIAGNLNRVVAKYDPAALPSNSPKI
jgi:hypothetical protein